jgi:hypothetical protein
MRQAPGYSKTVLVERREARSRVPAAAVFSPFSPAAASVEVDRTKSL